VCVCVCCPHFRALSRSRHTMALSMIRTAAVKVTTLTRLPVAHTHAMHHLRLTDLSLTPLCTPLRWSEESSHTCTCVCGEGRLPAHTGSHWQPACPKGRTHTVGHGRASNARSITHTWDTVALPSLHAPSDKHPVRSLPLHAQSHTQTCPGRATATQKCAQTCLVAAGFPRRGLCPHGNDACVRAGEGALHQDARH
jgi:hypothetical protein